jgi:hypothetical protein
MNDLPPSYEQSRFDPKVVSLNDNVALTESTERAVREAISSAQTSQSIPSNRNGQQTFIKRIKTRIVPRNRTANVGGNGTVSTESPPPKYKWWNRVQGKMYSAGLLPRDQAERRRWKETLEFIGYVVIGGLCIALFVITFASIIVLI